MKKILYLLIYYLPLIFTSCSEDQEVAGYSAEPTEVPEVSPDYNEIEMSAKQYGKDEFKDFYKAFFVTVLDDLEDQFNTFIHPEKGVFILDKREELTYLINVKDISNFKTEGQSSILSIDKSRIGYEMIEAELPSIDCNTISGYDYEGCFTKETNLLLEVLPNANLSDDELKRIDNLHETVTKTVVNTANYTYYFSHIDNSWYLTFLDIRKPC